MNRYSGLTGWMWMGWFGCGAYLGGPMRERVGCIVSGEPVEVSILMPALESVALRLPAASGVQWLCDAFGG